MVSLPWFPDPNFSRRNRLIVSYLVGLAVVILGYTLLYNYGMLVFEGRNQTLLQSFTTVVETMTTTGYGADSPWDSAVMNFYVVFMQLTGIGIGFFTLRVIIIPLFTGAEVDLDNRLTPKHGHVVVCEYSRDSAVLLDELEELGINYVLLSSEQSEAKDLSDAGYAVIHGSPQEKAAFERASLDSARAVITDAGDANVDTILTVRSIRPEVEIIALTDNSDQRELLLDSGADTVLSPRAVLGQRLAEKAVSSFTAELGGTIDLGADLEVTEIPVHHGSDLLRTRIRDSRVRERTGAHIIGAWIDGELQLPPDPDAVIRQNTVLLVSGGHDSLEELSGFTRPVRTVGKHERVVVAGTGEIGRAAQSVVAEAGIDVVTIDTRDAGAVDVVGDASTEAVLREAGIEEAGAIIVAVPDDSTALLTTVLARSLNPNIEVLVRVSDTETTQKALSGGADYVLSVSQISARLVARELRGEDILSPASQIRLVRAPADPFAGSTLADSGIYERTGCRVIAIEDDSGVSSTFAPDYRFTGDERIVLVGSDDAIGHFLKRYDVTPTTG